MRILLSLTSFLAIFFAATIVQATPFDDIQTWYHAATAVTAQAIRGSYAGRCFTASSSAKVYGGLLIVDSLDKPIDQGPGFPPADPLKMYLEIYADSAVIFDTVTEDSARATLATYWQQIPYANDDVDGTVGLKLNGENVHQTLAQAPNGYLVLIEQTWQSISLSYEVTRDCYFFKKLQ